MINEGTTLVALTLLPTTNTPVSQSGIINYRWDEMLEAWDQTTSIWNALDLQNTPVPIAITNLTF